MFKSKPIAWITAVTLGGVAAVALACRLKESSDEAPRSDAASWTSAPAETVRAQNPAPVKADDPGDIRLAAYESPAPVIEPIKADSAPPPTPPTEVTITPVAVPIPLEKPLTETPPPPEPLRPVESEKVAVPEAILPAGPPSVPGVPAVGESVSEMPRPVETPKPDSKGPSAVAPTDPVAKEPGKVLADPLPEPPVTPQEPTIKPIPVTEPVASPDTPPPGKKSPMPVASDPPSPAEPTRPIETAPPPSQERVVPDNVPTQPTTPPPAELPQVKPPEHPQYTVRGKAENLQEIARRTLGNGDRWKEILELNPDLKAELLVPANKKVRLPLDAMIEKTAEKKEEAQGGQEAEDVPPVKEGTGLRPLPVVRTREVEKKGGAGSPMTGTYAGKLDDKRCLVLPKEALGQMGKGETVLLTPGPDRCLWICTQASAGRMLEKLEKSSLTDADVQAFRRFYFAQSEKVNLDGEGKLTVPAALAEYSGLGKDVVLIGIDDHFELWDAARWNRYSRPKEVGGKSGE